MPLALDPNATFEIWLDSDAKIDAEKRPTFICKYLSDRELMLLGSMQGDAEAAEKAAAGGNKWAPSLAVFHDRLRASLVGWRNMIDPIARKAIPYAPDKTLDVLRLSEVVELLTKIGGHIHVSEDQAKKSERPSRIRSPRKSSKRSRR